MLKGVTKLYNACNKHKEGCNCQSVTRHGVDRLTPSRLQIRIITHYFLVLYFNEGLITNGELTTEIEYKVRLLNNETIFKKGFIHDVGRDSSVDTATYYWPDGPVIESRGGRGFPHLSRPSLGPTQPPVQWITDLFPTGKADGVWCWPPNPIQRRG